MDTTTKDALLDANPTALIKQIEYGEIALWSDDRRKEFRATFDDRARVSRFLLMATASRVVDLAMGRMYMSERHAGKVFAESRGRSFPVDSVYLRFDYKFLADKAIVERPINYGGNYENTNMQMIGKRAYSELLSIATERASAILDELPPVKKALEFVDKETARRIEKRDALLEKGQKLIEELEAMPRVVNLRTLEESMTVGEVLQNIRDINKKRNLLAENIEEIGKNGQALDVQIHTALYKGVPGITEAVIEVAVQHIEQATALDALSRRVGEKVMFGDSEAAMQLLATFEKDEQTVSATIKAKFDAALEKLKLAVKKGKK